MDLVSTHDDEICKDKILAMVILGVASLWAGMIPAVISERNRHRFPLTISLLLCFGGGILLATAMVHILPEVRQQMNGNFAEISLCGGLFIIYLIEEITHYFSQRPITTYRPLGDARPATQVRNYGSLNTDGHENGADAHHSYHEDVIPVDPTTTERNDPTPTNAGSQAMTTTAGLFVALSLHSAIEGLAIGAQNSGTKVLFLLGAITFHKVVMAFCLGLELRSSTQANVRLLFFGILIFAMSGVSGIAIGMVIVHLPSTWSVSILPIIQALSGGALLYIAICEIIPREKNIWHRRTARRFAGFSQIVSLFLGFVTMCLCNYFFIGDES